jgi:hypothetical protein
VVGDVNCRTLVLEKDGYLDGRVKMEGGEG